jgi:hypothetical protein
MQDAYNDFKCDLQVPACMESRFAGWVRTYMYEARLLGLKPNLAAVKGLLQ